MRDKVASPDRVIAEIAAQQHGIVSSRQLQAAGLDRDATARRARAGRLHRLHRGVYAVGHVPPALESRLMAAVLACSSGAVLSHRSASGAVLSHRSAACLWGLLQFAPAQVEVTIPGIGGGRGRRGIRVRRSRTLSPDQVTRHKRIPVTTPARTIADLRRVASPAQFRRALREAGVLGLDIDGSIEAEPTRSELEHQFLSLCRRYRLPMPETNVLVGAFTVDFLWRRQRLIVETDGYRYHRGAIAFEQDRARDVRLRLLGYEVVRLTYRQVTGDPASVAAALRTLFGRGGLLAVGTMNSPR